jgi:hypothetical protein
MKYLCWVSGAGDYHTCIIALNLPNYEFTDTHFSKHRYQKPYEPDHLKIYFPS